MKVKRRCVTGA